MKKLSNALVLLKPAKGYLVTPILMYANVFVFIVMVARSVDFFAPATQDLIAWGANFRPVTLNGEWWRLLSNCFLHGGFLHLMMNMYALLYIGVLLEPLLGPVRFAAAYLLCGLVASVTSLWWHDLTVSVGASGAIFGLYGLFLVMLSTDVIAREARKPMLLRIGLFVAYNLIYGLKAGIDNAAHLGGLATGAIIGYVYLSFLDSDATVKLQIKVIASLTIGFALLSMIVCSGLSNDLALYESKMKEFEEMEHMALQIYRINYRTKEDFLYNIKDRGIYYWNENLNVINEADRLTLPEELHERNGKIKTYCELRIKSYELLYKAASEQTHKYDGDIRTCEEQIGWQLKALSQNHTE